jgi:hypothetical protein
MIQRNGRINRLGSEYNEVIIANMHPSKDLDVYLRLIKRLENKIDTIKNTIGLDQGVLDNKNINPIDFIDRYYNEGEVPPDSDDDDILANYDRHMMNLRKFIAKCRANKTPDHSPQEIERIQSIPQSKWNYLPQKNSGDNDSYLALVATQGKYSISEQKFSDQFFFEVKYKKMSGWGNSTLNAEFLMQDKALDIIETEPEDNQRLPDHIKTERQIIANQVKNAAKNQTENTQVSGGFKIKPSFERAINVLVDYFDKTLDLLGTIRHNVRDIKVQSQIEKLLRDVNQEVKDSGSPNTTTLQAFEKLFYQLKQNKNDQKTFESAQNVLFYASKSSQSKK